MSAHKSLHDSRFSAMLGCLLIGLAIWTGAALVPPTAVAGTQEVILSQPSKDSGSKISSEDIPAYGLTSEVANDFSYPSNATITELSWWGGPYRTPDGNEATEFNIYVYNDNSCKPGTLLDYYLGVTPTSITQTGTDPGGLPIFRYDLLVSFPVTGGDTYWVSVQADSHTSPPQWGRQEGTSVDGCESMIRSEYFGYPDWVSCSVPSHHSWDASQEFQINTPTIEACCLTNGVCGMALADSCTAHGGTPQGTGTTCTPNPCPQSLVACCAPDGSCSMHSVIDCFQAGGTPQGEGTTCTPNPCTPAEACCLLSGQCEVLDPTLCTETGGTPQGPGSVCDPNPCPASEACCFFGGTCLELDPTLCSQSGGTSQGPGSVCDPNPCGTPTEEACCFEDGHCESLVQSTCISQGGIPQGPSTSCSPNPCPQPENEACCGADGSCTMALPGACVSSGGNPGGPSSTCSPNVCPIVIRTRATTWGGIKSLYR